MKKLRMILCLVISLTMVLTMTGMTASATDDMAGAEETTTQENATENYNAELDEWNQQAAPQESDVQSSPALGVQSVPEMEVQSETSYPYYDKNKLEVDPIGGVKVTPGYGRVKITWAKKKGSTTKRSFKCDDGVIRDGTLTTSYEYESYRWEDGQWVGKKTAAKGNPIKTPKTERVTWVNYIKVKMYTVYTYKIVVRKTATFTPDDGTAVQTKTVTAGKKINGQCVRKMRIKIKARSTRNLKSHDGKGKRARIKAGTVLWSDKYGGGNYYFRYNGGLFRLMRGNAKALKAEYRTSGDYSVETAEYFINGYVKKNKVANKKYLLWVSSYHQRLYAFKKVNTKSGKKWKCVKNWNVSMGMKSTPSPTGKKKIGKRIRSRHGISYWNCYSSLNALHGVHNGWGKKLGRLASHGCIRNSTKNAKWIWNHCPKGTTVLVY